MSPNARAHPRLTPALILAWPDAHRAATGAWPTGDLTPVSGVPGRRWQWVDCALCKVTRGLPDGRVHGAVSEPHPAAVPEWGNSILPAGAGPLPGLCPPRGSRCGRRCRVVIMVFGPGAGRSRPPGAGGGSS
jgi:hypothetical protein